jgi:hypothetical protein
MMKKNGSVNYLLVAVVILTGVGVGLGLSKMSGRRLSQGASASPAVQPSQTADTDSLKEKAKRAGGRYVGGESPSRVGEFKNLTGLTARSAAVIIGIPQENRTSLTPDGRSVTIDYKVRVEHVYKGTFNEGSTVTVSLPGGRIGFADGSTAEVRTPWFKKMETGKAYALFLTGGGRNGTFVTTGNAQGLFEIPTTKYSRAVQTHSGNPGDPIWKYNGMDVKAFLAELRQASGKAPRK